MMSTIAMVLWQDQFRTPWAGFFSGGFLLFALVVLVIVIIGCWKVFEKAGQPGWAILIPFFNVYILLKIAGRPGWWLLLYFIPLVNVAIAIVVAIDIAKAFGQSGLFGFFLIFLFWRHWLSHPRLWRLSLFGTAERADGLTRQLQMAVSYQRSAVSHNVNRLQHGRAG